MERTSKGQSSRFRRNSKEITLGKARKIENAVSQKTQNRSHYVWDMRTRTFPVLTDNLVNEVPINSSRASVSSWWALKKATVRFRRGIFDIVSQPYEIED